MPTGIQCGSIFPETETGESTNANAQTAVEEATTIAINKAFVSAGKVCTALGDDPNDGNIQKCNILLPLNPVSVTINCKSAYKIVKDLAGVGHTVTDVAAEVIFEGKFRCVRKKSGPDESSQCFDPAFCGKSFKVTINSTDTGANLTAAQSRADAAAKAVCLKMQTCTKADLVLPVAALAAGSTTFDFNYKCVAG